ncbi:Uncharacterised protein [uncultured Megasphaera sp.]|nr:Uncharacterised protein [uncultured Megasphaera sp.]SCJ54942.1 Uncharacterised protein [uncultured Ruminococcus sp.]
MKQNKNDIYTLIDEEYLSKFSFNHHAFMKDYGQFGYHFFSFAGNNRFIYIFPL